MAKLLTLLSRDVCRWTRCTSTSYYARPVPLEELASRAWNQTLRGASITKEIHSTSTSGLPKLGTLGELPAGSKTKSNHTYIGRAQCASASGSPLLLHGLFPRSTGAFFHISSKHSSRGTDFLQRHRQGLRDAPLPALTLGLAGLIPFVGPAVYTVATVSVNPSILLAQAAYGATILSFLGGVRWGFALTGGRDDLGVVAPTWSALGYSVMPSLIAWLGLLMPLQASQLCIMSGLLMAWAADMTLKAYPPWFRSLRLVLSLVALMSIGVAYGFCLVLEPTSEKYGSNVYKLIKIVRIILED